MKRKTFKTLLLTLTLGAAVFAVILPSSIPDPVSDPTKPASAEAPTGEEDIEPLSDLEEKKSH